VRSRARSAGGRTAARVLVAAGALLCTLAPAPAADDTPPPAPADATQASAEVERLRKEVELAFLDVKRDHAIVRAETWPDAPFSADFGTALGKLVDDARARQDSRSAQQEIDDAAMVVGALADRKTELPLTKTSLVVVFAEASRAARATPAAAARDVFVTAARTVFAAQKPEDAWDACFVVLPAVRAFRDAQTKLADAKKQPAAADAKEPPSAAGRVPDDMVLTDRARPFVGPWTGWTTDIPEKQNKRVQRSVKPVWFDRHEVTCAEYEAFVEAQNADVRRAMLPKGWTIDDAGKVRMPEGRERHPVTGVTFAQATDYAESLGKRLPTADEWERAAGGGEKDARQYPWGNSEEGKRWPHLGVEPKGTFSVDEFEDDATPEGIRGLAGNVAEMVATYPDRADVPKTGPEKGRQVFVCGGSFNSRSSECVTGWRWVIDATESSPAVGFRCVMDEAEYKKRHK
jgi:formylglycine-generating enzyme required for sulfatase activity